MTIYLVVLRISNFTHPTFPFHFFFSEPRDPPTLRPSDPPTFRPSDPPTFRPSDPPTLRPSDPPTLRPSDPPTPQPFFFFLLNFRKIIISREDNWKSYYQRLFQRISAVRWDSGVLSTIWFAYRYNLVSEVRVDKGDTSTIWFLSRLNTSSEVRVDKVIRQQSGSLEIQG